MKGLPTVLEGLSVIFFLFPIQKQPSILLSFKPLVNKQKVAE
jgi:hypothetical protein